MQKILGMKKVPLKILFEEKVWRFIFRQGNCQIKFLARRLGTRLQFEYFRSFNSNKCQLIKLAIVCSVHILLVVAAVSNSAQFPNIFCTWLKSALVIFSPIFLDLVWPNLITNTSTHKIDIRHHSIKTMPQNTRITK